MQLICTFVFTYAKIRFSYDVAHILSHLMISSGTTHFCPIHLVFHQRDLVYKKGSPDINLKKEIKILEV